MTPQEFASKLELAILGHAIPFKLFSEKIRKVDEFYQQGYKFNGICVAPINVDSVFSYLQPVCVIGYPYGDITQRAKLNDIECITKEDESTYIDYVPDFSLIVDNIYDLLIEDLIKVRGLVKNELRLIVEAGLLNQEQLNKVISIAEDYNVNVIKTSTGTYKNDPPPVERIKMVRHTKLKVKASGGIKDLKTALECIEAGADIIGSSTAIEIFEEFLKTN